MASFTAGPTRRRVFEPNSKRRKRSARALAARYDLNAKTVCKWRKRTTADEPMGPTTPKSTVLTPAEEAIVAAFPA
jgi:transposase-like protein